MTREIHVSAVLITDPQNRVLMVRKRGTTAFMQPGGKPEPGETPAQTAVRELGEELGLALEEDDLHPLGRFRTPAANEAGFDVVADCFSLALPTISVKPAAEIAEARWLTQDEVGELDIAPLSTLALLPLVWGRSANANDEG